MSLSLDLIIFHSHIFLVSILIFNSMSVVSVLSVPCSPFITVQYSLSKSPLTQPIQSFCLSYFILFFICVCCQKL